MAARYLCSRYFEWLPVAKTSSGKNVFLSALYTKRIKISWKINYILMRGKVSMTLGCNIWMICLQLNWLFYDLSRILQLSELYRRYVLLYKSFFNNFLFIGATDRNMNSSDQKQLFFAVSLYLLSFFVNSIFTGTVSVISKDPLCKDGNVW